MGKNILIFDDLIDGHHLEYLHHLHEVASSKPDITFIFSVPNEFILVKDKFQWSDTPNISWDFINDENVSNKKENKLLHSFRLSKILKGKVKQHSISDVFIVSLMGYLPMLPFLFLFSKVRISGIIYMIYLFRWKNISLFAKMQDVLKYILLSKINIFEDIFILNSPSASKYLCSVYNCSKFKYLPDPFLPFDKLVIQTEFTAGSKKIFLHFGSMTERKGTIEILESIQLMSEQELANVQFVFAGKIQDDIKSIFYQLYNLLKNRADIIVLDKFCSYEEIFSLCKQAECIIIPYKETAQSSGVIGYAAQFSKPVIAPSKGLVGKLVKYYHLGILIDEISPAEIYIALFLKLPLFDIYDMCGSKYISENSIAAFKQTIADRWHISL